MAEERIWLIHRGGFAAAKKLKPVGDITLPDGRIRVQVEHSGDILEIDEEDVEKV